jgi:hypothetical protein
MVLCKILDGIAIFDEEHGLICKIIGLSQSSFEKKGLIAIILKMKGLAARALGFTGFMIYFSIENPVDWVHHSWTVRWLNPPWTTTE